MKDILLNHSELEAHIKAGKLNYSILAYTIEKDNHNDVWELSIISTSMSELEGSDEGILQEYNYPSRKEAEQDIETIELNSPILLEKI